MNKAFLIILSLITFFFHDIQCQELPLVSQKFFNPYFINPAYAGFENRPAVFVGRRQQWTGIEGAPVTNYFNFHTAFGNIVPFGINIYNDERGIISTSHALLTVGFRARFDENDHYLSFALSGGAGFNNVDLTNVNVGNDPVLLAALENNIFLDGNAGLMYHNQDFNFGVSFPTIFSKAAIGQTSFEMGEFNPLGNAIAMMNYKLVVSEDNFAIDPWVSYHYFENFDGQFEGALRFILKNFVWVGGSYRMNYGASAFFGLNIKDNFRFGYAYELGVASASSSGFNNGSHEFKLGLIFGKTEKEKNKKSFYQRRRQMLNTMRGNTQQQQQNQNLYQVQNDPFETTTTPETTTDQPDTDEVDLDAFMDGYQEEQEDTVQQRRTSRPQAQTRTQTRPTNTQPTQTEEPSILSTFDTPQTDEVTTRDESGIYIGPKVVTKGDHLLELEKGYYVIVGTFNSYRGAEEFSDKLFMQGFYTKFGYISQTTDYYVYLFYSEDNYQECEDTIDRFKQITAIFNDMWVLTVQ